MDHEDKFKKVLIVDDEKHICEMLSEFFSENGFGVETSFTGKKALEKIEKKGFSVMLLDIKMPDVDGIEILKKVKKIDPDLPVIMMTGNISANSAIKSMRYGAYDYITKPFDLEEAFSAVRRGWEKRTLEIQNRILLEELKKKVFELEVLYETANAISYTLDHKELLRSLLESLQKVVKYDLSCSLLVNRNKEAEIYLQMINPVTNGFIESAKKRAVELFNTESELRIDKKDINIIKIPELKKSSPTNLKKKLKYIHSNVFAFLKNNGKIEGVINLSGGEKKAFTPNDIRLLNTIASQMSSAIRGLRGVKMSEKSKMDKLVESMSDGVIMTDEVGNIVVMNPQAMKMLCYRRKEDNGIDFTQNFLRKERNFDLDQILENLKKAKGRVVSCEIKLNFPQEVILTADATEVKSKNGHFVGAVIVLRDITEQKCMEKMKSEFVSNISHEFRTPLTSIKKSVSILISGVAGSLNGDQKEFLSITRRNVERLNLLINAVLDFSKLESRKMKINKKLINLCSLCDVVFKAIQSQALEKKIKLQKEFCKSPVKTYADPERIEQVLTNLLGNAIKFTPEGGKVFLGVREISAKELKKYKLNLDSKRKFVVVWVKDTGIGIKAKYLDKIFDRFHRIEEEDEVSTHKVCGTGLGLAISKEIVGLHGGRIWAQSEFGKGSTFYFIIPAIVKRRKAV